MARIATAFFCVLLAGCSVDPTTYGDSLAPSNENRELLSYLECDFSDHAASVLDAVWQVSTSTGHGTAFHLGDGQWLTAEHVIAGNSSVTLRNGGVSIPATVVGSNTAGDTALLDARVASTAIPFGRAAEIGPGHQTYAVGFPLYDAPTAAISRGILSRVESYTDWGDVILTDTAVSPGNSGGPLLNECGQTVGMIIAGSDEDNAEGINWAIAETTLQQRVREFGGTVPDQTPTAANAPSVSTTTTATAQPPTTTTPVTTRPVATTRPPTTTLVPALCDSHLWYGTPGQQLFDMIDKWQSTSQSAGYSETRHLLNTIGQFPALFEANDKLMRDELAWVDEQLSRTESGTRVWARLMEHKFTIEAGGADTRRYITNELSAAWDALERDVCRR